MKYFILLSMFGLVTFNSHSKRNKPGGKSRYRITRLDSINSYYLIYAADSANTYKIVSKKEIAFTKRKVTCGESVELTLEELQLFPTKGDTPLIANYLHFNCFPFDDSTRICFDKTAKRALYKAKELHGIFYNKK